MRFGGGVVGAGVGRRTYIKTHTPTVRRLDTILEEGDDDGEVEEGPKGEDGEGRGESGRREEDSAASEKVEEQPGRKSAVAKAQETREAASAEASTGVGNEAQAHTAGEADNHVNEIPQHSLELLAELARTREVREEELRR